MFTGVTLVPLDVNIRFIPRRMWFFVISGLLVAISVALFTIKGLNYGIDFKGGILIEVRTPKPADLAAMRGKLSGLGLGDVSLQEFGHPNEVLIRVQRQEGDEAAQQAALEKVKSALGAGVEYRRTEFVGPQVSEELFWDGVLAVTLSMIGILIYVWFRFEWQFGLAAIIALVHDVLSTIGIFALLDMEFNLTTVAAVLTIAGYSINDTVVVFDRIRENLRKFKKMPLPQLLNDSVNQTLSRTVITGGTTLAAVVALYALGGEVIRGFSFAIIWGILVGTYSSVCLAAPLLLYLNIKRGGKVIEEAAAQQSP
ncbi:MAG: protein translocase subunit SecF [Rhodospirillales bacterium]|nr:protein translocase subunit SecF [Rhodospirillales bacterium]